MFLNQTLLDNPADALPVLTEEIGHHLETLVREGDSPGDEGELFARTLFGETFDSLTFATLRRKIDNRIIKIDGYAKNVEFFGGLDDGPINTDDRLFAQWVLNLWGQTPTYNTIENNPPYLVGGTLTYTPNISYIGGNNPPYLLSRMPPRHIYRTALHLNDLGLTEQAERLANDGVLPHRSAYDPESAIGTTMLAHYDRLAQEAAQRLGISTSAFNDLLDDLYDRNETLASKLLTGELLDGAHNRLATVPELNGWLELFLNDQILPPLTVFEPGSPLAADMATLYDRLAQRVADGTGVPLDIIKDTVNDLSTRNGIKASDLLLGKLAPADIANAIAKTTVLNESIDDQTLRERVLGAIDEGINDFGEGFVDGLVALAKLETYENALQLSKTLFLASSPPGGILEQIAPEAVAQARTDVLNIAQSVKDDLVNEWSAAGANGTELELIIKWTTQGTLEVATSFVAGGALTKLLGKAPDLIDSFKTTSRLLDDVEIRWGFPVNDQGADWENYLEGALGKENRLPPTFKTFDFYDRSTGTATSAKTLNTLTDPRLDNPRQVFNKLKADIDAAADPEFSGRIGDTVLTAEDIDTRELRLAVPEGTTTEQWLQIDRALGYAESKNVNLIVNLVQ